MYKIDEIKMLRLGQRDENLARAIPMDASEWLELYPGASIQILFRRPGESTITPMVSTLVDGILTWQIHDFEVGKTGVGNAEIRAVDTAGLRRKSRIIPCSIEDTLLGDDETVLYTQDQVDITLAHIGEAAQAAIAAKASEDAAALSAQEAADAAGSIGTAVEDTREYKEAAEQAAQNARTAQEGAEAAESDVHADAEAAEQAKVAAQAAQAGAQGAASQAAADRTAAESAMADAEAAAMHAEEVVEGIDQAGAEQVAAVNAAGATQVGNVNAAGTTQVNAVQAKGTQVINSIPADYSALTDEVTDLKSAFDGIDTTTNGGGVVATSGAGGRVIAYAITAGTQYAMINESNTAVFTTVNTKAGATTSTAIIETLNTAEVKPGKYCILSPTIDADYLYFYCNSEISVRICELSDYQKSFKNQIDLLEDNKIDKKTVIDIIGIDTLTENDINLIVNSRIMTADGSVGSNSTFTATDYIDVSACDYIVVTLPLTTASSIPNYGCAFYDANKAFIASFPARSRAEVGGYYVAVLAVPETAMYFRTTWWSANRISELDIAGMFAIKLQYKNTVASRMLNVEQHAPDELFRQADTMLAVDSDAFPVIPESLGAYNVVRNARQLTDIIWTPKRSMPGLLKVNGVYTLKNFPAGVQQRGIPYSGVHAFDNFVGFNISLETWQTAVENPESVLYTMGIYNGTLKRATYYGIVCSKFGQYALGVDGLCTSNEIATMPGLSKVADAGNYTEADIQIGDILNQYGIHTAVITGLFKTYKGVIKYIEVSEAVTPLCRRVKWSVADFFDEFAVYNLYRYDDIDNVQYKACPYVNVDGSGIIQNPDKPLRLNWGDKRNIPTGTGMTMACDITKWKSLYHYANGELLGIVRLSASPMSIPTSVPGYHELYAVDDSGIKSVASYFNATSSTITHIVSGNQMTITYSSIDKAKYVQWTAGNNITNLSGAGEDTITIPDGMTQFRVAFESDYGVWFSAWTEI